MKTEKRTAKITRVTNETTISLELSLDPPSSSCTIEVSTGYGMADHMLTAIARWAGFGLTVSCKGDLHIDAHHTVEDVAMCFGQALDKALGDRKGIARVGNAKVPMDEAIADVAIDLSGRSYLVFNGQELLPPVIAGEESDIWREFFRALSSAAKMNLHVSLLYGRNGHHLLESACKGIGLSLRAAIRIERDNILSTKGSLD